MPSATIAREHVPHSAALEEILARHAGTAGPLLPVLHAVQEAFGYIPPDAVPRIAEVLCRSRAEVHGLITFFHDLRLSPPGRRHLRVCRAEACQSVGGRAIEAAACAALGVDFGDTTHDGEWTLDGVYCLGNCAAGPSVQLDGLVLGRMDAGSLAGALARSPAEPAPAPAALAGALTVFVPNDTTACSLGADAVADALLAEAARLGRGVQLVRNGSRGAYWLEPMIEIEREGRRIAFGPVSPAEASELLAGGFDESHARFLGDPDALPWFAAQQRRSFRRSGRIDPLCCEDYVAQGGTEGLRRALAMSRQGIVDAIRTSGLRGRGGAAFPAGIKWQTVHDAAGECKYVVCNAEEGDSGTFADRLLIESDPFQLLEGMAIAGLAVGAETGFIGLRYEYPAAARVLGEAIALARAAGWLGADLLGSGRRFDVELRIGAGAYVCGEETSLLEILEGRRGTVRAKPPLPAISGLFGKPTLIHNVLSLAAVPGILADGA
ncbi:MAG: NAD(P)H-dependent oxidoreductase subunit E, partial [Gammaproteobacteria bacterium]